MSVKTSYKSFYGNPTSTISFRKVIVFLRFFCWKYLVLRYLFCLAEAFLALGMRNGWKYLIANLIVSLNLLSTRLWMAKEIALTTNRKPPNKILGTNLVPSTIPCKFGVGQEEVWVQWWVRLTKERENNDFFTTEPFFLHSFCLGCRCFANVCKLVLHNRMTRRSIQLHQERRQKCW